MKILLIHQYFLGKNQGGGSRFNEMTKIWSDEGHEVTVIAGWPGITRKTNPEKRHNRKYVYQEKGHNENIKVFRCHVSAAYNVNFLGRLWAYFTFVFSSIWAGLTVAISHLTS